MSTRYYQEGSLERVGRAKGPDVWMYRWRDGRRVQRKKVLGNVEQLKTKAEAKREVENFRAQINSELEKIGRMTLGDAWGHFQHHELRVNRSPTTINSYLDWYKTQSSPCGRIQRWMRSKP